ncbi:MAG: ArsB/NhaD family transporter [Syntrophomonadaceae bacterium]|nr:ArsB/NhaD family transporter [Syntrophomonadaceae bacterium]
MDATIAVAVFVLAYGMIMAEKLHRAMVSLAGAVLIVLFGILTQEEAFAGIDWNTIGLLVGMMIIVGITRRSGVFEFLAIWAAKVSKGRPVMLLVLLTVITAFLSAFLDNVTTVLLIVPVTFAITDQLKLNPVPFLICEVIGSNIGGTATLIGDPPNILIGSATQLGFNDFIINLAPVVLIIMPVIIGLMVLIYGRSFQVDEADQQKVMAMNEWDAIRDWVILKRSLAALALTILGFFLHQALHLESATIALAGAVLLMIVTREEPEDVLLSVEWPTLFFFMGVFVMVEGLVKTGVITNLAQQALVLTQGNFPLTAILILWVSAFASAIVDNIPFVAAMIPLLKDMGAISGMPMDPLWWSLALGACLGGNGTLIGASANVVVAGIAERNGFKITFWGFTKIGMPLMIVSVTIATGYIYLRYLM